MSAVVNLIVGVIFSVLFCVFVVVILFKDSAEDWIQERKEPKSNSSKE